MASTGASRASRASFAVCRSTGTISSSCRTTVRSARSRSGTWRRGCPWPRRLPAASAPPRGPYGIGVAGRARSADAADGTEGGADPPLPRWPFTRRWQRRLAASERPVRERNAVWVGDLCIVPAGPNVNVYLIDTTARVPAEEIEARYPGALSAPVPARGDRLRPRAGCPGTAVLLSGPGAPHLPAPRHDGLSRVRPTKIATSSCEACRTSSAMPSGGDVILYGHYADAGCVNFLDERGSHAGPSEDELYAFLATPPGVAFDFRAVTRARDLHPLFARDHAGSPDPAGLPGVPSRGPPVAEREPLAPERELRPDTFRFCPLCGGAVVRRVVARDMREYPVCSGCGFVCYLHPKIVAVTIPVRDGRVLRPAGRSSPLTVSGRSRADTSTGGRAWRRPRVARCARRWTRPRAGRPGRYLLLRGRTGRDRRVPRHGAPWARGEGRHPRGERGPRLCPPGDPRDSARIPEHSRGARGLVPPVRCIVEPGAIPRPRRWRGTVRRRVIRTALIVAIGLLLMPTLGAAGAAAGAEAARRLARARRPRLERRRLARARRPRLERRRLARARRPRPGRFSRHKSGHGHGYWRGSSWCCGGFAFGVGVGTILTAPFWAYPRSTRPPRIPSIPTRRTRRIPRMRDIPPIRRYPAAYPTYAPGGTYLGSRHLRRRRRRAAVRSPPGPPAPDAPGSLTPTPEPTSSGTGAPPLDRRGRSAQPRKPRSRVAAPPPPAVCETVTVAGHGRLASTRPVSARRLGSDLDSVRLPLAPLAPRG